MQRAPWDAAGTTTASTTLSDPNILLFNAWALKECNIINNIHCHCGTLRDFCTTSNTQHLGMLTGGITVSLAVPHHPHTAYTVQVTELHTLESVGPSAMQPQTFTMWLPHVWPLEKALTATNSGLTQISLLQWFWYQCGNCWQNPSGRSLDACPNAHLWHALLLCPEHSHLGSKIKISHI
jgi:hypothetical protein